MAFVYKEWYEKNREKVNAKRRKKYAESARYREKLKRQSRKFWRDNYTPSDATMIKDKNGIKYYSISHFARAINRAVVTVQGYHSSGVLPEPFYNTRGWRLYTKGQIALASKLFKAVDEGKINLEELRAVLAKKWR
jgi:hypothetical protein